MDPDNSNTGSKKPKKDRRSKSNKSEDSKKAKRSKAVERDAVPEGSSLVDDQNANLRQPRGQQE